MRLDSFNVTVVSLPFRRPIGGWAYGLSVPRQHGHPYESPCWRGRSELARWTTYWIKKGEAEGGVGGVKNKQKQGSFVLGPPVCVCVTKCI